MKKLFWLLFVLLTVIFVITGCSDKQSESATTTVQSGGAQSPQSGSSSSSSSQASGGSESVMIKPEQLISKDEAGTLISEAVKAGVNDEYPLLGLNTCYYAPENSESKSYLQISVMQKEAMQSGGSESSSQASQGQSGQSGESASSGQSSESASSGQSSESGGGKSEEMSPKSLYEGLKKIFSDSNTAVTGHIGDDTFMSSKSISILSGEYCIVVSAGSADPILAETILKQAAEMAVKNLERVQGK